MADIFGTSASETINGTALEDLIFSGPTNDPDATGMLASELPCSARSQSDPSISRSDPMRKFTYAKADLRFREVGGRAFAAMRAAWLSSL